MRSTCWWPRFVRRQVPINACCQWPELRSQHVGSSGSVKMWDLVSGKLRDNIYIGSPVLHIIWVDINSHRNTFLTASEDGSICIYSCRAATFLRRSLLFKVASVISAHFSILLTTSILTRHIYQPGHIFAPSRPCYQEQWRVSTIGTECLLL